MALYFIIFKTYYTLNLLLSISAKTVRFSTTKIKANIIALIVDFVDLEVQIISFIVKPVRCVYQFLYKMTTNALKMFLGNLQT